MSAPILIGFADALAAIESTWCLADDGFEVTAFARRGRRPPLAAARAVRIIDVTPPEQDACQCAAEIAIAAQKTGAIAVLPLDDHAVWLCDQAAAADSDASLTIAGPTGDRATLALDKRDQLKLAEAAGFQVPPTTYLAGATPAHGPWMVKPALAVELRERRLHRPTGGIATSAEQVEPISAGLGGPAIVQTLIDGVGEGIFGLACQGTATVLSAHRRVRMMNPRGSGSSACRSIPVAPELICPVRDFIGGANWDGLFMIELLRDRAGVPWFMELNGRAWGSMALARYKGDRYPSWAVQSALDPGFRPLAPPPRPEVTARHLGRELVHLGIVLARADASRFATAQSVLRVRRADRWYNYRRGEARVFAADSWATVRDQVTRRLHRDGADDDTR